ncbi:MAG: Gfo/Idh/MocA family protein, partial [Brachybacterium tyrofermentans]
TGTNNGKLPDTRAWFTDVGLAGGGSLVDHTVHIAEILDSMVGPPTTVHATTNRILWADRAGAGAETGGLVTLTYDSGLVATIDCSWSQPADAPTWGGLRIQAVGTGGQLQVDAFAEHVGGPGQWLPYGVDSDTALLEAFLGAVRAGEAVEPSGDVGLRTVRVVAAAQESVRTGQPVELTRA